VGARPPAVLRRAYDHPAGIGRNLRPPASASRETGRGRVPDGVRRHCHAAPGGREHLFSPISVRGRRSGCGS
jgi:hypothetical protein